MKEESKQLGWNRVFFKGMYVLGVNSTVTKHSDYFVWKDTSQSVARRCDDTVDTKRVNSCVLKTPILGGSWATKKIAKRTQKCSLQRTTNVNFQKQKK